ncbi:MAG: DNA/RNA nuclease SfsA, partial [Victivallaceae bacterium]
VKGVTLENNNIASFPDAPTARGVKHVEALLEALKKNYESYIFLVIQMTGIEEFRPNDAIDSAFGKALRRAVQGGVKLLAFDSLVTRDSIKINSEIKTNLTQKKETFRNKINHD